MTDDRDSVIGLLDGQIPWTQAHRLIQAYKGHDRFQTTRAVLQERVQWDDPIVLPLTPSLFIVDLGDSGVIRCKCGHPFGDWRRNWKESALIRVLRDPAELADIFGPLACDPDWMEIREFICPGCAALLEVEAAAPGYPFTYDFQPDLEVFYRVWLNETPPRWATSSTEE